MVRDALIRGLGESDIQQDVLGHNDQDMTLEDTIRFIEAKEAGKRSQATLQNPSAATVSSYKQTDKDQHVVKCQNLENQAMVMSAIHRLGRKNARPGTKFVQSVTKGTTSPTSVGLNPKRSVETQRRMQMNSTLCFTKCVTSRYAAR